MITQEEIEQPRTPGEWVQFVALKRAEVEGDEAELQRARRKDGIYKMFVDEVMPLASAAHHLCGPDERLQPVRGNQGYDAVVLDRTGVEKGRVEIGKPYDGRVDAIDARLLEERGYGSVRLRDLGAGLEEVAPRILKTAREKSMKDYRDSTLLLVGVIDPPFPNEVPALEGATDALCEALRSIRYRARRVLFVIPPLPNVYVIQ